MTTLSDVVCLATTFATDFTDLKGNTWAKYGGNATYPRVTSGSLQMGLSTVSLGIASTAINLPIYRSWQIQFDVYFGTLGSASIGQYGFLILGNIIFNWRGDNVANRLGFYGLGVSNNATIAYMSVPTYTAFNTITLEYHDSAIYLYLNGALMTRVFDNGHAILQALTSAQNPPLTLGAQGVSYSSLLLFKNVRVIQGAAPLTEGITDPGFTSAATPRSLLDPATLTPRAGIKTMGSYGIRRPLAAGAEKSAGQLLPKRIVPGADKKRLGRISGTVKVGATAVSRPVALIDRDTMRVLASTVSDASGVYRFDYVPQDLSYMVVAKDPTATYNAVVADRVTPVSY